MRFSGAVWLFAGGTDLVVGFDDLWTSTNGKTWTQISKPTGGLWPTGRFLYGMAFFRERLWLCAGGVNATTVNDAWSFDGAMWQREADLPARTARFGFAEFLGRLWIVSGYNSTTQDVYYLEGVLSLLFEERRMCVCDV